MTKDEVLDLVKNEFDKSGRDFDITVAFEAFLHYFVSFQAIFVKNVCMTSGMA